jgi:hypothetical protein
MAPFSNRDLASVLEDGRQHRFDAITAAARVAPLSDDALFLLLCEAAETEGLAALQEAAQDELRIRRRERSGLLPVIPATEAAVSRPAPPDAL